MPLGLAIMELNIAELLYLNYKDTTKPITMYINSSGTTTADKIFLFPTNVFFTIYSFTAFLCFHTIFIIG
jgi:hypothetical protein